MKRPTMILVGLVVGACGGSGGSPLTDGGLGDSTTDGSMIIDAPISMQDVAQGGDASDAASNDASDGPTCGYCSTLTTTPSFCSDFDSEMTPSDWDTTTTTMGGTVAIESTQYVSCPHGLEVTLPMFTNVAPENVADAIVSKTITTTATVTQVSITLEAYLPANDTKSYVVYFGAHMTGMQDTGVYFTHHADSSWWVTQNGFGLNFGLMEAPLTGAWNQMTLTFGFGQNATVTLQYTGADNMVHTATGMGNTGAGSMSTTIDVGMIADGTTEAAFTAYYDNVVVQLTM